MSDPKPSTHEIFCVIYDMLERNDVTRGAVFSDSCPFPDRKFILYEPQRGVRRILEVLPGDVLVAVSEEAVRSSLVRWAAVLDPAFANYKLIPSKAEQAAKFWVDSAPIRVDVNKIKPVRQKNEKGYCWHRLPFDVAEGECPTYEKLIGNIEHNLEAMEAFLGATIFDSVKLQNYLWKKGEGNDGKGSLDRFLRWVLQDSFVTMSDDPKKQDKFFTWRVFGKRLGCYPDATNKHYVTSGDFLSLTGNDPIWMERKGKDGNTVDINCHFMFSSNKFPAILGSVAHIRRAIIVTFKPREEQAPDPNFEANLRAEAPHILYRWMQRWAKMRAETGGFIKQDKSISVMIADETEEGISEVFDKMFVPNKDGCVTAKEFVDATRFQGLHDKQIGELKDWMTRNFGVKRVRKNAEGRRYYIYTGISLLGESNMLQTDDNPQF